MTPARWLLDNSALSRLDQVPVAEVVIPRIGAGLVGVSILTELKVASSARSTADYRATRESIIDRLLSVPFPFGAEPRARDVQRMLVERGEHRSAGVADLLLAAIAEIEGLTLWHYDADFDVIAEVTGQAAEWIVPRGTVD